jgi:hypothetical protein
MQLARFGNDPEEAWAALQKTNLKMLASLVATMSVMKVSGKSVPKIWLPQGRISRLKRNQISSQSELG